MAAQVRKQEGLILGKRSALRHNFVVTYRALVDRLQEKPYFINFQNILCSRTEPVYQPDGIHLQDEGRNIVARHIRETLKERLLIAAHLDTPQAWARLRSSKN